VDGGRRPGRNHSIVRAPSALDDPEILLEWDLQASSGVANLAISSFTRDLARTLDLARALPATSKQVELLSITL
jgi:hypothetical protein